MTEPKQYLAHKLNGPVMQSMLQAQNDCYEQAKDWLEYRNTVSAKTATTEDLNMLGVIVGAQRPYAVINGQITYASDEVYRRFLLNIATLRRNKSIFALATMLTQFIPNGLFEIHFKANGDLRLVLDIVYEEYAPFLQRALDSIYTALPRINPIDLQDFHLYFRDDMFFPYYVQLDQPNVWTFIFDEENEEGLISATDPSLITYNSNSQRLEMSVRY